MIKSKGQHKYHTTSSTLKENREKLKTTWLSKMFKNNENLQLSRGKTSRGLQ